jgi:FkbM family methyltransferase
MRVAGDLKCHYLALGIRGVLLSARSYLLEKPGETIASAPGIAHPIHLRLRTSDVPLLTQVILHSQYDWRLLKPPNVIVDAGANIGLASIFFANRYPGATILAVEPAASNLPLLRRNMAPYPNCKVVAGALWNHNATVATVPGEGEWGFRVEEDLAGNKSAAALTLDRLMQDYGIDYVDLLKVDIEGAEKEVFESSSAWIDRVGAIAIELHDEIKLGCSRAFRDATRDFVHELRKGETIFVARSVEKQLQA